MKIVKKVTKIIDNPDYRKGNGQKKKIENITTQDISISYLFDTAVITSNHDGQIEKLQHRVSFLEDVIKILIEANKSKEILSFLAKIGNDNRPYDDEGDDCEYSILDE